MSARKVIDKSSNAAQTPRKASRQPPAKPSPRLPEAKRGANAKDNTAASRR